VWPARTPVSLNAWGFTPAVFPLLSAGFSAFERATGAEDEFLLPESINQQVARGLVRVRVLEAPGPWIGVTWSADVPRATEHLARILAAGEYQAMQ
jgi:hypothetical protein